MPFGTVMANPFHILKIEHRPVSLPIPEIVRGEREETLPRSVSPRWVNPHRLSIHQGVGVRARQDWIIDAAEQRTQQAEYQRKRSHGKECLATPDFRLSIRPSQSEFAP